MPAQNNYLERLYQLQTQGDLMGLILITVRITFIRKQLSQTIKAQGHIVVEATSGPQCIEVAEVHSPDCILLDLSIPELNGFGVLQRLCQIGSRIPVIVMTEDIRM